MATLEDHFIGRTHHVREIYDTLLAVAGRFGEVRQEPKKTSIHLARRTAFAGVVTRRDALILTLKSAANITDTRILRAEQTSANRWHLELRLTTAADVDAQVREWIQAAYELAA
jgi:Domain of unknown function (DUF5655)